MSDRSAEEIKEAVRRQYGGRAREYLSREAGGAASACCGGPQDAVENEAPDVGDTSCCATSCCSPDQVTCGDAGLARRIYTQDELETLPAELAEESLGCGNPTAIAELSVGEVVLDLGSGAGLDCFLASHKVGSGGRVVGLDMSREMVELAGRNAAKLGIGNVAFRLGEMEAMPFRDAFFDVIISNCVINLSPDKDAVFREAFRVLKPGGRLRVSDIVWLRRPTEEERSDLTSWTGCLAGALMEGDYLSKLAAVGFADMRSDRVTEGVDPGLSWTSAYISATKPLA